MDFPFGAIPGVNPSPYRLERTMRLSTQDDAGAPSLNIDLAWPAGDPPSDGWPLLVVLDGERSFATVTETVRRMAPRSDATGVHDLVVAAISLPAHSDRAVRFDDFAGNAESGGSSGFARTLAQASNLVETVVPIDLNKRTLLGHSLSGYFVLRTMVANGGLFQRHIALSPSIWVDRDPLFTALDNTPPEGRSLFLAVGGWEEELAPWQVGQTGSDTILDRRRRRRMVSNVRELGDLAIRRGWSDESDIRIFPEDEHASIVTSAMPHALRSACRTRNPSDVSKP
ncbi:MAG: hypothetical protein K5799_10635 [Erythrobacter sp.]|nr:hypothetical protein [Erythrobacter sp.]